MNTIRIIKNILFVSVITAITLYVLGCESKIVSPPPDDPMLSIRIDMTDASPKLLAAVNQYRVIVVDPATSDILVESPLTLNGPFIEGRLDSLPTEKELLFTAQALKDTTVIYEGSALAILAPEKVNQVSISMSPVVPILKTTPRYYVVDSSQGTASFPIDVKIFNVDSLFGVSFRVRYDNSLLRVDSAFLAPNLSLQNVIFFDTSGFDISAFRAMAVSHTVAGSTIVDASGNTPLTRVYFSSIRPASTAFDTSFITLEATGITLVDSGSVSPLFLFVDETVVIFDPDTLVPVPSKPSPPQCPMAFFTDIDEGSVEERVVTIILWVANIDQAIAGYNVYRNIGEGFEKINGSLITTNPFDPELPNVLFFDSLVDTLSQNQYQYYVTAVDDNNEESGPSDFMKFVPSQVWSGYATDSIFVTSPQHETYLRSLSSLAWNPTTGAESYLIVLNEFIFGHSDVPAWAIRSSSSAVGLGETADCTYFPFTFTSLLPNTEYGFEVYGVNADNAVFIRGRSHFVIVPNPITGITETDDLGNVLSVDSDDWCPTNGGEELPQNFGVSPAYPNPTDGRTTIGLVLPQSSNVCIRIINASLELVRTFGCQTFQAGYYNVSWDGTDNDGLKVSPGIYRCYVEIDYDFVLCHGDILITDPPQQTPVRISPVVGTIEK